MSKWFVRKFLDLKIMKDILASHIVNDANHKLKNSLKVLFTVLGWVFLVIWVAFILWSLFRLTQLWFAFSLWIGLWIYWFIYIISTLLFSLISLFTWIGMIRFKKWTISLIILLFVISVILFIITLIPVESYYISYGNFSSGLFNLIITFVVLLLVIKNENMFK